MAVRRSGEYDDVSEQQEYCFACSLAKSFYLELRGGCSTSLMGTFLPQGY